MVPLSEVRLLPFTTSDLVPAPRVARKMIRPMMDEFLGAVEKIKKEQRRMRNEMTEEEILTEMRFAQLREAEDIKKKKFMTKKFVGSVVALLAVVGIGLGVKFGLPYLE